MNACRLFLLTPRLTLAAVQPFVERFAEAVRAGEAASALVRLAPGSEGDAKRILAPLTEIAVANDCALLIENDARLAARLGLDGVHIMGAGSDLEAAIDSLHPDRIVGAGNLRLRDEAMVAGEAGADYVMFGEPRHDDWTPAAEDTLERVGWWAEIFQTPCIGYAVTIEDAAALAAAGADFVALCDAIWSVQSPAEAATKAVLAMAAASAGNAD
jgi:thiamine-phosphate pyrophosphorylase